MQAALNVDTSFGERFNFSDEGGGIDYDASTDDCLLFGAQDAAGDELQDEAVFADDYGVPGVVSAGDARDIVKSAGQIIDDFAFALVAPLRADHHDRFHAVPSLAHMCHPHTSLSGSEKEVSGGNYEKNTETTSYAALGLRASAAGARKRFNTENTEREACLRKQVQSSQRRARLARRTAKLFVAVAGHGVVVDQAGGLHQCVADRRTYEAKAALDQVFAQSVGVFCSGRE